MSATPLRVILAGDVEVVAQYVGKISLEECSRELAAAAAAPRD